MTLQIRHITLRVIVMCIALWSGMSYAQLTAHTGEITTLSVADVPHATIGWELYVPIQGIDFATNAGNCPTSDARFVAGNQGNSVQVQWLTAGTYYYKATVTTDCGNNLKIGKITVGDASVPQPAVHITYNCDDGTALLEVKNPVGDLLWSTGETTTSITIDTRTITQGRRQTYSVVQIRNGINSIPTEVQVLSARTQAPDIKAIPTTLHLGDSVTLSAVSCVSGTLHWYNDQELTQEITNLQITPQQATTLYAVCRTEAGCESEISELALRVIIADRCKDLFDGMNIPNAISPNGDRLNDVWILDDLRNYCLQCNKEASLKIFNRWGEKIYEKQNYMLDQERFEGYSKHTRTLGNGKLPAGTYFYVIEFDDGSYKSGYLYIGEKE